VLLIPIAILRTVNRALFSTYITIRLRLIDEELARLRDVAIRTSPVSTDWFEGSPHLERPRTKDLLDERERLVTTVSAR
jgi:hypothetical protein